MRSTLEDNLAHQKRKYNPLRKDLHDLAGLHLRLPGITNRTKARLLGVCERTIYYWNRLLRIRGILSCRRTPKLYRGQTQIGGSVWFEGVDLAVAYVSVTSQLQVNNIRALRALLPSLGVG